MKRLAGIATLFLIAFNLGAQDIRDIVQWEVTQVKTGPQTYEVTAEATIKAGWYVYSQFLAPDEGPIPTYFTFDKGFKQTGKRESGNKHEVFDPIFEMHVAKFSEKAQFTAVVKVPAGANEIKGSYIFMTCDDTKCLPPVEIPFTLSLLQN